jgi:hypothetical protein
MAHKIELSKAWCNEHLAQCWHEYDHATQINKSLCNPDSIEPAGTIAFAKRTTELKQKGYTISHHYPKYIATLWKAAPLNVSLEWQLLAESKPEYIDVDQDW